jgi:colanic acid biosynthesis glycosyl transferase WcaI
MKILVHSIFYRPELTGVAKYTAEMCEWLAARGHEVEVVCPPPYYPQWRVAAPYRQWRYQRETLGGVRITRCPLWLPKTPGGVKRIVYSLSFMASSWFVVLTRIFRRPDVVVAIEPSFLNAIPCLLLARMTGAMAWLHVQDYELDLAFELGQLRHPWLGSILRRFESWIMRRFDVVSTISRPMEAKARAKGVVESRFVMFPDWVDTNVIFPGAAGTLRAELGIASDDVVALFSGTLGAKQGIETIIAAAKMLGAADRIAIVICGEGAAAARLKSQAEGLANVRFIPLQPAERLNELLNTADIHLLPQVPEVAESVLPSKVLGMLAVRGDSHVSRRWGAKVAHGGGGSEDRGIDLAFGNDSSRV